MNFPKFNDCIRNLIFDLIEQEGFFYCTVHSKAMGGGGGEGEGVRLHNF